MSIKIRIINFINVQEGCLYKADTILILTLKRVKLNMLGKQTNEH